MENTHIKNLDAEIPKEIRLQVYKESLDYIIGDGWVKGLCLLLPMKLWGLPHLGSKAPDGNDWNFEDTSIAFPELTEEVIDELIDTGDTHIKYMRVHYLKQWIRDLEAELYN